MKNLFSIALLLAFGSLFSQNYLFKDDFGGNTNNWPLTNDSSGESKIENGRLSLSHTAQENTKWIITGIYYDPDENFEIETSIKFVSGETNSSFGLVFGGSSATNFYA